MSSWNKEIDLSKYKKGRFINRGSFGEVYEYNLKEEEDEKKKKTNNFPPRIAVKRIFVRENADQQARAETSYRREFETLVKVDHVNVLGLFLFPADVEDDLRFKFALEFCNGDLHLLLDDALWTRSLSQVRPISFQVARGLMYLHANGIVHRDIKPGNILLQFNGTMQDQFENNLQRITVKLSDFDLSRILERTGGSSLTATGTMKYMSPEVAKAQSEDRRFRSSEPLKTDVFSTGIVFFRMRYREVPFRFNQLIQVGQQEIDFREDGAGGLQGGFNDLCYKMMRWDLTERIDMEAVLNHDFFASAQ